MGICRESVSLLVEYDRQNQDNSLQPLSISQEHQITHDINSSCWEFANQGILKSRWHVV